TWLILLSGLVVTSMWLPTVEAVPAFKKEFENKYVKPSGTKAEKALAERASGAKCNICHVAGRAKTERNVYGQALSKYVKKADAKNVEKIKQALSEVESLPGPNGQTFGEMMKDGLLPDGN